MTRVRAGLLLTAAGGIVLGIALAGVSSPGVVVTLEKALVPSLLVVGFWLILIGRRADRGR